MVLGFRISSFALNPKIVVLVLINTIKKDLAFPRVLFASSMATGRPFTFEAVKHKALTH